MKQAGVIDSAIGELRERMKELEHLKGSKKKLQKLHASLLKKAGEIEAQIGKIDKDAISVVGVESVSKTVAEQGPLWKLLCRLFASQTSFSISEAANAALAAGYQTKSNDFRSVVNALLRRNSHFVRVRQGRYRIAGSVPSKRPKKQSIPDFIYLHAPKGHFQVSQIVKMMRGSLDGQQVGSLSKTISASLGRDRRFRHVKRGVWVRTFPGYRK